MPQAKWKNFTDEELRQIVAESYSLNEVQRKLGYSGKSGATQTLLKQIFAEKGIDYSHFKGHAWNKDMSKYEDALTDFGTHTWASIKEQLFAERGHQCECCGITTWNGKEIIMQVHHIDGNHNNNTRVNLVILCPNCHSQTDNWTYKKTRNKVTDEQFLEALLNTANICQARRIVGLNPNQSNYKRAKRLLQDSES